MKRLDRSQCISDLRAALLRMAEGGHSICDTASRKGAFCKGFSQWSDEELRRRHAWLVESRPHVTRAQLERLADVWQVARQEVFGTPLACDTQCLEHDTCRGFDEFTDAELARFHLELCGEPVEIASA